MRNLNYKVFSYRLNDKTAAELKKIKFITGLSCNLLFTALIKTYKKSHQFKKILNDNLKKYDKKND